MAPYSPKTIANALLSIAGSAQSTDMSPMKLQKLIYYAHAWSLALLNKPLINHEIQAWTYGPVVEDIYHEFKGFGNAPITSSATELAFSGGTLSFTTPTVPAEDLETWSILNEIWRVYGGLSPVQLSNLTHAEDSPWYAVAKQYSFSLPKNVPIPDLLIQSMFVAKRNAGRG